MAEVSVVTLQLSRWDGAAWDVILGPGDTPPVTDTFILGETKPTAANTGSRIARSSLTPHTGDYVVTTPGVTVSGLLVTGRILVRAANVVVRDCIVEAGQGYTAGDPHLIDTSHSSARNTLVQFCEASSGNFPGYEVNGIGPKSVTVDRCNIHDVVDGGSIYDLTGNDDPVIVQGSFIHDLFYITPDPNHSDNRTHNDGIQSQGGPASLLIRGNTIDGRDSVNSTNGGSPSGNTVSCVMLNTNSTRTKTAVTVEDNWLNGGGDTINGRGTDGGAIIIRRNRFGAQRDFFPVTTNITDSSVWTVPTAGPDANTYETGGALLASTADFTSAGDTIRRYF